jgi:transcriptional regulator with XRE-family HTH domain
MPKRIMESPLDEALDAAGLTAVQLAKKLNVTVSEVSRWRRRRTVPVRANQERIAKALGVSVTTLWPEA